jgi:hypothetical protein
MCSLSGLQAGILQRQNDSRVDLAKSREVSQVLFKKSENFVKGDREIVSGLHE